MIEMTLTYSSRLLIEKEKSLALDGYSETGLLGLAAAQPTAQEIASAMPRQPVQFDPFLKGLSPFQPLTPLTLRPVQEKDALSELNKFIGRQSGMLV